MLSANNIEEGQVKDLVMEVKKSVVEDEQLEVKEDYLILEFAIKLQWWI